MPGGCQASLAQPLNYHSTPSLQLVHTTLYRITWFELKSTRRVEQKHCTIMHQKHFIMHTLVNLIIMHWTKKIFPIPISSHAGKATSHALNIGWSYSQWYPSSLISDILGKMSLTWRGKKSRKSVSTILILHCHKTLTVYQIFVYDTQIWEPSK